MEVNGVGAIKAAINSALKVVGIGRKQLIVLYIAAALDFGTVAN